MLVAPTRKRADMGILKLRNACPLVETEPHDYTLTERAQNAQ